MQRVSTLEEALSLVPKHWLLDQEHDTVKGFDERYVGTGWETASADDIGGPVWMAFRRPIPQDVRERVAKLLLAIVESGIELESSSAYPLEAWILAGKP